MLGCEGGASSQKYVGRDVGQQAPLWMGSQGEEMGMMESGVPQRGTRVGSQGGLARCREGPGGHSPTAQPRAHGSSSVPIPGTRGQRRLVATGPARAARAGLQEKELEQDLCAAPLYY